MKRTKAKIDEAEAQALGASAGDRATELFGLHPGADALYFTSDGLAFFEEGDANAHARSLEKKEVSKVEKPKI
jgi:hypothetical protein